MIPSLQQQPVAVGIPSQSQRHADILGCPSTAHDSGIPSIHSHRHSVPNTPRGRHSGRKDDPPCKL